MTSTIDYSRRPWAQPEGLLIPDFLMRGVRALAGHDARWKASEINQRWLAQRYMTGNADLEITLRAGMRGKRSKEIFPEDQFRVARNKGDLLRHLAKWCPIYIDDLVQLDTTSNETRDKDRYGPEEPGLWLRDWVSTFDEINRIRLLEGLPRLRKRKPLTSAERRLTRAKLQQASADSINVELYMRDRELDFDPSMPLLVLKKQKTFHSLAEKVPIRIVRRMTRDDASQVIPYIRRYRNNPEECMACFAPYIVDLDVWDVNGLKLVYITREAMRQGRHDFFLNVANYNIWWGQWTALNVREARQLEDKCHEDYEQEGKRDRRYDAVHDQFNSALSDEWRFEDDSVPWGFSHHRMYDLVEVHFTHIGSFLQEWLGETRHSHWIYEGRKGYIKRTLHEQQEWSDAHWTVFDFLKDACHRAWRKQQTPDFDYTLVHQLEQQKPRFI